MGAREQVVTAEVERAAQGVADDAEVGDPGLHLGELDRDPVPQPWLTARAEPPARAQSLMRD